MDTEDIKEMNNKCIKKMTKSISEINNKKKYWLSKSTTLVEIKQQNALVYIAISFIHSFIGKPMDMNYLPGIL